MKRVLMTFWLCLGSGVFGCGGTNGKDGGGLPTPHDMSTLKGTIPKYIFVTSASYSPIELGVAMVNGKEVFNADETCKNLADNVDSQLFVKGKKWIAWLSYNNPNDQVKYNVINRIIAQPDSGKFGPWQAVLPANSTSVLNIFADVTALSAGPQSGFRYTEKGIEIDLMTDLIKEVWTGTLLTGIFSGPDLACSNGSSKSWSTNDMTNKGTVGAIGGTAERWTNSGTKTCDLKARLICLEI